MPCSLFETGGIAMNVAGVIDMHIHTGPDIRPRRLDDIDLAREAARLGVRAVVIKSHVMPTAARAVIAEKVCPNVRVFGGIVLNPHVGGINPLAVDAAIKTGAKIIWLPTMFSSQQRRADGKNDGIETVVDSKVVPPLTEILKQIAAHNLVLGTGHLAPREIFAVVAEAQRLGVKKIVVTHPEIGIVNMPLADQKALAASGVYFERCYAQPLGGGKYKSNFAANLEAIDQVGYQSTIISTDSGQVENPVWSESLVEYLTFLKDQGIPQPQLDTMTKITPAKMLDLD
jgi:hypothetical protein